MRLSKTKQGQFSGLLGANWWTFGSLLNSLIRGREDFKPDAFSVIQVFLGLVTRGFNWYRVEQNRGLVEETSEGD